MNRPVLLIVAFSIAANTGAAIAGSSTDSSTTPKIVIEPSVLLQINTTTYHKDGNDRFRLELDAGALWHLGGVQLGPTLNAGFNEASGSAADHGFSIGANGQLRREVHPQIEIEGSLGYSIEDLRGAFVAGLGVRKKGLALRLKLRHSNVADTRSRPFGAPPDDKGKQRVNEVYVGFGGDNKIFVWSLLGLGALVGIAAASVPLYCAVDGCSN